MEILWTVFDIAGTIAFAVSGALVGISRNMDVFGIFVLALSTAIGGGIVRDVLVGNIPPVSLTTYTYIGLTAVIAGGMFILYHRKKWRYTSRRKYHKWYLLADTLGLASFTVTGTTIGFAAYPQYPILAVLLGLVTAVGGGVIRDLLAGRIPSILQDEIYAFPAIVGGIVYYFIAVHGYWYIASPIAFLVVFVFRMVALYYHLNLPKVR